MSGRFKLIDHVVLAIGEAQPDWAQAGVAIDALTDTGALFFLCDFTDEGSEDDKLAEIKAVLHQQLAVLQRCVESPRQFGVVVIGDIATDRTIYVIGNERDEAVYEGALALSNTGVTEAAGFDGLLVVDRGPGF